MTIMNTGMTFQEFVSALVDEVNKRGADWADTPVMIAGNGSFSPASLQCVQFKDVPASEQNVKTFNPETRQWEYDTIKVEPHKVVVFSAPESDSMI